MDYKWSDKTQFLGLFNVTYDRDEGHRAFSMVPRSLEYATCGILARIQAPQPPSCDIFSVINFSEGFVYDREIKRVKIFDH